MCAGPFASPLSLACPCTRCVAAAPQIDCQAGPPAFPSRPQALVPRQPSCCMPPSHAAMSPFLPSVSMLPLQTDCMLHLVFVSRHPPDGRPLAQHARPPPQPVHPVPFSPSLPHGCPSATPCADPACPIVVSNALSACVAGWGVAVLLARAPTLFNGSCQQAPSPAARRPPCRAWLDHALWPACAPYAHAGTQRAH